MHQRRHNGRAVANDAVGIELHQLLRKSLHARRIAFGKRTSARRHGMSHELPRRHSRNAVLWNVGLEDHSGLMPANLITFAHFSVSSVMSFPKSWGEPASTVPPRSASRAFILGSLLRLLTISAGVPGQLRRKPTKRESVQDYIDETY